MVPRNSPESTRKARSRRCCRVIGTGHRAHSLQVVGVHRPAPPRSHGCFSSPARPRLLCSPPSMSCGFLVLDKPAGLSSHSCVSRVRSAYGL
ncbi:MAG: hypothetical protein FJ051_01490, partial [Cyanobacteria bacterium M_surface_9_m1_291]|nr:hypothetical protein [Cyanobacteria bacterium M_surface_9_m1_291]